MKKLSMILGVIVLSLTVNAQNIMLSSGSKGIAKANDQFSGFQATFSYNEIESVTITGTEKGTFSSLQIAEAYPSVGNYGEPELPVFKKMIQIPVGATPKVVVKNYTVSEFNLSDYGFHSIFPVQPSVRKDQDEVPFIYDEKAYGLDQYNHSELAEIHILGPMRGIIIGMLTVSPIQYNPVAHSVMVYNDIEVEVVFENANYKQTEEMFVNSFSPYFTKQYDIVFNKGVTRDVYDDHSDLYTTPVRMLVVANRIFEQTLQPWIEWKTKKGFYMEVRYTDEPEVGTTAASIKTFIHGKYNAGIGNGTAPTFIILVGDTQGAGVVPASQTGSYTYKATDLYYARVNTPGFFPDMYYSRMSAQTTQQLENQIEKILYYEKYQFADPTYLDNVLLIAGYHDNSTWDVWVGRPTINYANTYYYNADHGYADIHKYVTNNYTGCYAHFNNVGFANYTAHCGETEWSSPNFTVSQVSTIDNKYRYFVAMGNCCLAADFGYTGNGGICFGEALMQAQQKGAVGYIGSSPSSYWGEDFHFGVGAYAGNIQTVTNPTLANTKTGVYDFMFRDADFNTLCSHVFGGNLSVQYAHDNPGYTTHISAPYYWEAYNVLGDGSLMPYNAQGSVNTVSHLPVIHIGLPSYEVMAAPGSYVAISKDGELLGVAVADVNGIANVTLDPPITSGGDVDIVVTRNQYIPYIAQVPAVAQVGPYVVYNSYEVGDGDILTYISTDEEIEVTLKNVGIETSGELNVTISCADPQLTITQATATCAPIAPDATATVTFKVTVANDIPDGKNFPVDIAVSNGGKTTWESKMPLKAYAPKFSLEKILVNGVENGSLAAGSLAMITTVVKNAGGADAYNVKGDLEFVSEYITIACAEKNRATVNLEAGESMTLDFYVITDPNMPYGYEVNMGLLLTAAYEISYNAGFKVANTGADNYCVPGSTNCSSYNDRITSIQILQTSNQAVLLNDPAPTCNSNGYTDYTNVLLEFIPGEQYTIKVKTGYSNHKVKGWIDLNGNNAFDSNESMFVVTCASANTEYSANFTIPQDFAPGSQRFRIRTRDGGTEPDACGSYSWGQTLDYTAVLPELYPRVQNVVAVLAEPNINITWEAPDTGTPTGYNVYRDGNKLNATPLTATSFTEENVAQGVYAYNVTALYTGNKESFAEMSNVICNFIACEPPANLAVTMQGTTAILTWEAPENIEGELLKYNIYRDEEKLGEVPSDVFEYQDKNLDYGTYVYQVSATYEQCDESEKTDGVTIVVRACEPPTNLIGTAEGKTAILTWNEPETIDGELLGYNVYRDEELIEELLPDVFEYRDEELENGTYIYQLSAVYEHCEESALTAGVAVTIEVTGISNVPTGTFQIFPNPAHNELNITGNVVPTAVRMYNITGQLVYETDQCATKMKISVAEMPEGVYFIKIDSEYGNITRKVVVN
ncbi:MAG: C25 family cysteine peptidase [Bacteroidales bacterium]|nr:C25 family cysteine peptidase [Bacteroidales bacterium]